MQLRRKKRPADDDSGGDGGGGGDAAVDGRKPAAAAAAAGVAATADACRGNGSPIISAAAVGKSIGSGNGSGSDAGSSGVAVPPGISSTAGGGVATGTTINSNSGGAAGSVIALGPLPHIDCEADLMDIVAKELEQRGCRVLAREWWIVHGKNQFGRGDLVFQLPSGEHLVVEVKCIPSSPGYVARASRTRKRAHLREQVQRYLAAWRQKHPDATVKAAVYTSDKGLVFLEEA